MIWSGPRQNGRWRRSGRQCSPGDDDNDDFDDGDGDGGDGDDGDDVDDGDSDDVDDDNDGCSGTLCSPGDYKKIIYSATARTILMMIMIC